MAGKPDTEPMRADHSTEGEPAGDPRHTEEMSLLKNGGSVSVVIPNAAVKFLGYEIGERREVRVYDDGVFIPTEAPDDE